MSMDEPTWRYLLGGRVLHALEWAGARYAICGRGNPLTVQRYVSRLDVRRSLDNWRGTGNQDEYERAAVLPRCKDCVRMLRGAGDAD